MTAGGGVNHIAVADLNGDTFPDLAVVNTSTVTVVPGNGNGTFGTPTSLDAGTPDSVSVGDFNGDGSADLVATSFIPPGGGGSAVLVWLNNGAGGFGGMTKYLSDGFGANPIGSAVADFDQDGKLDIVAANNFADTLSLWTGAGDRDVQPADHHGRGRPPDLGRGRRLHRGRPARPGGGEQQLRFGHDHQHAQARHPTPNGRGAVGHGGDQFPVDGDRPG